MNDPVDVVELLDEWPRDGCSISAMASGRDTVNGLRDACGGADRVVIDYTRDRPTLAVLTPWGSTDVGQGVSMDLFVIDERTPMEEWVDGVGWVNRQTREPMYRPGTQ